MATSSAKLAPSVKTSRTNKSKKAAQISVMPVVWDTASRQKAVRGFNHSQKVAQCPTIEDMDPQDQTTNNEVRNLPGESVEARLVLRRIYHRCLALSQGNAPLARAVVEDARPLVLRTLELLPVIRGRDLRQAASALAQLLWVMRQNRAPSELLYRWLAEYVPEDEILTSVGLCAKVVRQHRPEKPDIHPDIKLLLALGRTKEPSLAALSHGLPGCHRVA